MNEYTMYARMIDHSLLNPSISVADLDLGCHFAVEQGVASVCIVPYHLARCSEILKGSNVRSSTVIGFPHGVNTTTTKVEEMRQALKDGGEELDMVINISKAVSGEWDYVREEIHILTDMTHNAGQKIKVIFENYYLTDDAKIRLCEICSELGCDWVKTSTGYAPGGSTNADLRLMRAHAAPNVGVKSAGGVRTLEQLIEVREAGADRCGTSRTAEILAEAALRFGQPVKG
jgi:deoxyribose-phosphate aldolase